MWWWWSEHEHERGKSYDETMLICFVIIASGEEKLRRAYVGGIVRNGALRGERGREGRKVE